MNSRDLTKLAEDCRKQATTIRGAEKKLLLEVADAFQEIALSRTAARNFVDATRCW